jgi:hypothetical protein
VPAETILGCPDGGHPVDLSDESDESRDGPADTPDRFRRPERRYAWAVDGEAAKTWILTGSLDNFRATRERGFRVIGMKERRRRLAEQVAVGDQIVQGQLRTVSAGDAATLEGAMQGATQLEPAA